MFRKLGENTLVWSEQFAISRGQTKAIERRETILKIFAKARESLLMLTDELGNVRVYERKLKVCKLNGKVLRLVSLQGASLGELVNWE